LTTLPAAGFFTGEITNQEAKDAQDGILAVLRELPGGAAEETRIIASGAITPQRAVVAVDTEDQAPADDLDVVNPTHHPPGRLLLLRAVDQVRPVTVRHAQGGPGEVHLAQGLALTLQQPRTWLVLLRRGDVWHEVLRAYGDDAAGARIFLGLWSRGEADARFARLAAANVFTQDQLIQHAEGDDSRWRIKRGAVELALLAAAADGRLGTLSNHDLVLLRHNQPKVTILASRVELDGHVDANGRFRTLGMVRTEMRSGASVGVVETGTDHNLLIRRNAVAHIELRGNDTTDFKQPITRQDHTVWDNGNTPRSLGQNGYQQLPSGWIIQWGFAASWGSGDGTITFPIAFPVACRSVQATHLGPDNQFWSARDQSTTGFTIRTSSSANSGYWWLAIGR
jgi:hypothetical protein